MHADDGTVTIRCAPHAIEQQTTSCSQTYQNMDSSDKDEISSERRANILSRDQDADAENFLSSESLMDMD